MTKFCTDPRGAVYSLIAQSAPEREQHLEIFRNEYPVEFNIVDGRFGIVLNADKYRVELACKDLQVMWLLGFSLWKSIELFSPVVLLSQSKEVSSTKVIKIDTELHKLEYYYRGKMAAVLALIGADKLDVEKWPQDIPLPVESREKLSNQEDMSAFDLVMMATAVLFLHELKHVEFHTKHAAGEPRPSSLAEEELLCDVWAREWFMSKLAEYAQENGYNYQQVCSKRAMALLFVCEYLRLAAEHAGAVISSNYPPLAQRVAALSGAISLPSDDNFWILSACVLLAETRRQGIQTLEFKGLSPKEMAKYLIGLLDHDV